MKIFLSIFLISFMLPYCASANNFSLYEEYQPEQEVILQETIPHNPVSNHSAADNNTSNNTVPDNALPQTQLNVNPSETPPLVHDNSTHYFLTAEKHNKFLLENQEYALADTLLNQTWKLLKKKIPQKTFQKILQEQKKWLEQGRNDFANMIQINTNPIPEDKAFMMASVVRTQELALNIWHEARLGKYTKKNLLIIISKSENATHIQGYSQKNLTTGTGSKNSSAIFDLEFLPKTPCWQTLETQNGTMLFLLTLSDCLCIVHEKNALPIDFNGIYSLERFR